HRPDSTAGQIDDGDLASIRYIGKGPRAAVLDLETLRMTLQREIADLGPAYRVYYRQPTLAVAHQHSVALRIDANIVGVLAEIDAAERVEIFPPQQTNRTVAGICHIDGVGRRLMPDPLRFAEPGDPA